MGMLQRFLKLWLCHVLTSPKQVRTEPRVEGGTGLSLPNPEQEDAIGYTAKGVDMGVEAFIQPISHGTQKREGELDRGGSQIRLDRIGSHHQARQHCPLQMTWHHHLWASSPAFSHRVLSVTWLFVAVYIKRHPSSVS